MCRLTLHFFERAMAEKFIALAKSRSISGTTRTSENAPRHHVSAHCADERERKKLTEAWGKMSVERH